MWSAPHRGYVCRHPARWRPAISSSSGCLGAQGGKPAGGLKYGMTAGAACWSIHPRHHLCLNGADFAEVAAQKAKGIAGADGPGIGEKSAVG